MLADTETDADHKRFRIHLECDITLLCIVVTVYDHASRCLKLFLRKTTETKK